LSAEKTSPAAEKPKYISLVPAVEQAVRILLALAENASDKSTLTEISRTVGIHKGKGYSLLKTLLHFGLVKRDPKAKTYSLGPCLLFLSSKVLASLDLREAAAPFLKNLATETKSTAFFGLIADQHVFVVAKDEGIQEALVTYRLGHRFPLAWGAHGKAIVAHLPEAERDVILAGDKRRFHGSSLRFNPDRLKQELDLCRQVGFSVDLGEMQPGIHAVAAPVFASGDKLVGAIVVIGTFPKQVAERYGAAVAAAGREFSMTIGGLPQGNWQTSTSGETYALDRQRTTKKARS
jgi:DNA-binding IclR family transcriptional regulator